MGETNKTPRPKCSICRGDNVDEINSALFQGATLRVLAEQFNVTHSSLHRHKNSCIRHLFDNDDMKASISLLTQMNELREGTDRILEEALDQKDYKLYLQAADRKAKQIEIIGKLVGQLPDDDRLPKDTSHQAQDVKALLLEQLAEERGESVGPVTELPEGSA